MEQMGFERIRNSDVFNFKTVIGGGGIMFIQVNSKVQIKQFILFQI
jgi:hypothetical protein